MRKAQKAIFGATVGSVFVSTALFAEPVRWPTWVNFSTWQNVDEGYRGEFRRCDLENKFREFSLNQRLNGKFYYGCSSDRNQVTFLKKRSERGRPLPLAVAFSSKLSVDLDGSWYACNTPGKTDQCGTSLEVKGSDGKLQPVSSDTIPYIVMPTTGPTRASSREFATLTGVGMGDFGIIVTADTYIPIIVADGGLFSKLGEGSIALHRRLGKELCKTKDLQGRCTEVNRPLSSIEGPIIAIIKPGSKRRDITAANLESIVKAEGAQIWAENRTLIGR